MRNLPQIRRAWHSQSWLCALPLAAVMYLAWVVPPASAAQISQPGTPAALQTGNSAPQSDAATAFAQGSAALQTGDLDLAEKYFRQVLRVDPRSGAAYANLGVVAMRRKNWDAALKLLRKAQQLAPKMAGIRLNIALVEFRRANYANAIAPLASVLRDSPDSSQARYLLGLCQVLTEKYADALSTLEPMWPQRSSDVMYLYLLSIAAHDGGNADLEQKSLARMLEVAGDSAEMHLILGKAYLNRTETDKAIAEFERAAAANSQLPFVHFNLGLARIRTGQEDLAEQEFLRDIAIEPDLADDYAQLGILYTRQQKSQQAEKAFAQALERDPRMATARFGLAQIYFDQMKFADALREADAAAKLAPDSHNVHYLRARILARLGRAAEAKTEMALTQKLMNQDLGKARADLGDATVPNPELTRDPR